MAERIQKQVPERKAEEEVSEAPQGLGGAAVQGAATERGEKLKADLDDLLDEIDEVLEVNAEDFVRSYVQKGGE